MSTNFIQKPRAIHDYLHKSGNAGITSYVIAGAWNATQLSAVSVGGDTLRAVPFILPSGGTLTEANVYITTGAPGGEGLVGIYSNISDDNLYPSGLLGEISTYTTDNIQLVGGAFTGGNIPIRAGKIYWAANVLNTSATHRCLTINGGFPIFGSDIGSSISAGIGVSVSYTWTGSMPANFPAGAGLLVTNTMPAVRLSVSLP